MIRCERCGGQVMVNMWAVSCLQCGRAYHGVVELPFKMLECAGCGRSTASVDDGLCPKCCGNLHNPVDFRDSSKRGRKLRMPTLSHS